MRNFNIETSLPFPFLELNEIVSATEVKKPSGVTYMILVLLKESKNKNQKISSLLESFGIPKNLHSIYADEIRKLLDDGIIIANDIRYQTRWFSKYELADFYFSSRGEKVFAEEQIATGKEKESKVKCYYDVALNQLSLKPDPLLEVKALYDNAFDDSFVQQFECKKNVEEFLDSKKGPSFQVKAAEVITKVELQEKKSFVGNYGAKLIVDRDSLTIKLDHKLAQEFFDEYYNADFVNKAISLKKKFKLDKAYDAKLSNFNEDDIYEALLPKDYTVKLSNKYSLVLTRDKYNYNKQNKVVMDVKSIDAISKYADYVCVDGSQVYAYCPVKLELDEKKLGKIYLPLVLVLKPSLADFAKAISNYIDTKTSYSYESYTEIIKICNVTKDYKKAISMLMSYMTEHEDDNIVMLNEVKPLLTSNTFLLNEYKKMVTESYNKYMKNVKEDSLDSSLKITAGIPTFIGLNNTELLSNIMQSIKQPKRLVETYELLVKHFNTSLVLVHINPFEEVLKNKKANSQQLLDIITFDEALESLKKITGIKNYSKYTFDEDELIKPEFKKDFVTAHNSYKNIQIFKPYNLKYFDDSDKYMNIFGRINDNLNILDAAIKNPKNIKADLIEKKIVSGDYQFVLINLSAKLDLLLTEKFNVTGTLADKLNASRKKKYLSKEVVADLHELRENRNALAHPEDRTENYNADDLRRWSKEVFDIEEAK